MSILKSLTETSYPKIGREEVIEVISQVTLNEFEVLELETKVATCKFVGSDDKYPTFVLLFELSPFEFFAINILYWTSSVREVNEYEFIILFVSNFWVVDDVDVKSK